VSFAFPQAFLFLVLVVPVVLLLRRAERAARRTASAFGGIAPRPGWFTARRALAGVAVAALAVVGTRPYVVYDKSGDFLFLVDVSRSMDARHTCSEPTFLGRARQVMLTTLDAIPEARAGIVAFDRFAFPVTQMTADHDYLREVIDNGLYVGLMLAATQTDIANALSVVAGKKNRLPGIYGEVEHVVLLSDGHVDGDYRRRLSRSVEELRAAGIRVSAVGIGNPVETPIADSENGQCVGRYIEQNGDRVLIPLRADVLKFVATESGGEYFAENETSRLIDTLRAELRVRVAADSATAGPRRDVSLLFLGIATLALLGFLYLPARFPEPGEGESGV
jgi:hypothetical protein